MRIFISDCKLINIEINMIKKLFVCMITYALLIILFSGCIDNNLDVDYKTIQESIDHANDRDTIYIQSGTYYETLVINKSINLIGEDKNKTIIDCKNSLEANHIDVILINADNCTIKGFKVTNTNVSSDVIGIQINSSNNTISNNIISRVNKGMYFSSHSKNNNVYENNISNNQEGLDLTFSHDNNISKNNITLNSMCGIGIHSLSQSNMFFSNIISDNKYGAHLNSGMENKFFKNDFISNKRGIYICCGARYNIVYNNLFKKNSECNARDVTDNQWNVGSIGNYWDDYAGVDKNDDGKGDMPYNIAGGNNQDMYPKINPP